MLTDSSFSHSRQRRPGAVRPESKTSGRPRQPALKELLASTQKGLGPYLHGFPLSFPSSFVCALCQSRTASLLRDDPKMYKAFGPATGPQSICAEPTNWYERRHVSFHGGSDARKTSSRPTPVRLLSRRQPALCCLPRPYCGGLKPGCTRAGSPELSTYLGGSRRTDFETFVCRCGHDNA